MAIQVVSTINRSQTIDSVALAAYATQKRDSATAAVIAAAAAKTIYYSDLKGDVDARSTEYAYTQATGTTVDLPDDAEMVNLKHAATIAALTVNMPVNPRDGQVVRFSSVSIVTALTMSGTNGGDTIVGALTTIGAGGFGSFMYDKQSAVWRRIG